MRRRDLLLLAAGMAVSAPGSVRAQVDKPTKDNPLVADSFNVRAQWHLARLKKELPGVDCLDMRVTSDYFFDTADTSRPLIRFHVYGKKAHDGTEEKLGEVTTDAIRKTTEEMHKDFLDGVVNMLKKHGLSNRCNIS